MVDLLNLELFLYQKKDLMILNLYLLLPNEYIDKEVVIYECLHYIHFLNDVRELQIEVPQQPQQ